MSEWTIVSGLCIAVASVSGVLAGVYRIRAKQDREDKLRLEAKLDEERIKYDEMAKEAIKALTLSTSVIENITKVLEETTNALNIVKYRK